MSSEVKTDGSFKFVTLNIGGVNTSPLEFMVPEIKDTIAMMALPKEDHSMSTPIRKSIENIGIPNLILLTLR
jgi:hypothetical protein